jgi:hypothetical protein
MVELFLNINRKVAGWLPIRAILLPTHVSNDNIVRYCDAGNDRQELGAKSLANVCQVPIGADRIDQKRNMEPWKTPDVSGNEPGAQTGTPCEVANVVKTI